HRTSSLSLVALHRSFVVIFAADEQEDEHDDWGEGSGPLDIHEDGVEAHTLEGEDVKEKDEKGEDEDGKGGFEAAQPAGDDDEEGGEDELHRQVVDGAGEVIGGEVVHAGGAFFEQHRTFLGEDEDGVKKREEAP
ncbi:hypothetical protein U1Q18_024615, partial [Sarracenia purpurea var. burkii]